ncbi:MAG: right-handed parallel beta-helix repeat-containing protein [Candidatus Margulisiibacteriota bacterium]
MTDYTTSIVAPEPNTPATGNTYYVSTSGNDSTGNGSLANPWASPGYASRQLQAGDTLIIRAGNYVIDTYDEDILTPPSGTASNWIIIKGEDGTMPTLAGGGNILCQINISNANYLKIENLEITNNNDNTRDGINGVYTSGNGTINQIILKNIYIHHIDMYGVDIRDIDGLYITNCRIEYCGFGAVGGPAANQGGWQNVVLRDGTLSYSGRYYQGIADNPNNPYARPDGFGIEPGLGPVEIFNITAEGNNGDGIDTKTPSTHIHNCYVIGNRCDGVKLWGDKSKVENTLISGFALNRDMSPSGYWSGITIGHPQKQNAEFEINNVTVYDHPSRNNYSVYFQYPDDDPTSLYPITVTMRNCIIANGGGSVYAGDVVTLNADHNLFYRNSGTDVQVYANRRNYSSAQIGELGTGNLSADPKFVAPVWGARSDYSLQAASPALDAGSSSGVPALDINWKTRPQGAAFDIGAFEK